ncbi:hypothetical protein MG293_000842 [Ovis ammon polii]|uniref:Uncharacterized protein n=1 Tax=Ovis ammon polii TaxID=230172 RepID=A0AAD4UPD1_OVIAM|nr:hypothetical protein MG293_000842 [Ovis ammon polii]
MKVKSESEVAQRSPTVRDPMDCSPPGSSAHGIFQAKIEYGLYSDGILKVSSNIEFGKSFTRTLHIWRHSKFQVCVY